MKQLFFILISSLCTSLFACKNYYNDTIQWADDIKQGTDIENIKNSQPDFIEIAWNKPDTLDSQILYEITNIKGNKDILNMQHFLVFNDHKYCGRTSKK